jgi:hypothetical protein
MNGKNFERANEITKEINTLKQEISTMENMEDNTRRKKECTHRLCLKKLLSKPTKKTAFNYWSSQDVDSIHSIILFDPDEVKALIDFKKGKLERLKKEFEEL